MSETMPVPADTPPVESPAGQWMNTETKVFTRANTKREIKVAISWPSLYPDYEPWAFTFRLAFSKDMYAKRQEWLALTPAERDADEKMRAEIVDEVCDLLVTIPTGFGDLDQYRALSPAGHPSSVFRNYYNDTTDPDEKETLFQIVKAANYGYWAKVMPQEFRPQV